MSKNIQTIPPELEAQLQADVPMQDLVRLTVNQLLCHLNEIRRANRETRVSRFAHHYELDERGKAHHASISINGPQPAIKDKADIWGEDPDQVPLNLEGAE
jgi:hypothetical protein